MLFRKVIILKYDFYFSHREFVSAINISMCDIGIYRKKIIYITEQFSILVDSNFYKIKCVSPSFVRNLLVAVT